MYSFAPTTRLPSPTSTGRAASALPSSTSWPGRFTYGLCPGASSINPCVKELLQSWVSCLVTVYSFESVFHLPVSYYKGIPHICSDVKHKKNKRLKSKQTAYANYLSKLSPICKSSAPHCVVAKRSHWVSTHGIHGNHLQSWNGQWMRLVRFN